MNIWKSCKFVFAYVKNRSSPSLIRSSIPWRPSLAEILDPRLHPILLGVGVGSSGLWTPVLHSGVRNKSLVLMLFSRWQSALFDRPDSGVYDVLAQFVGVAGGRTAPTKREHHRLLTDSFFPCNAHRVNVKISQSRGCTAARESSSGEWKSIGMKMDRYGVEMDGNGVPTICENLMGWIGFGADCRLKRYD